MSTLKVANLQNTGSGAPTVKNSSGTEIGQFCKAWVNFNGGRNGSFGIRDDFNVSSVTDLGTGDFDINFTTGMTNTNYAFVGHANFSRTSGDGRMFVSGRTRTTSKIFVECLGDGGTPYDAEDHDCVIFGD